ncbi:hypothetical protein GCM10010149_59320 [Nonomuraea roseoviolacea subsp. roseoviolacea]|uniref:hypothetical protein n=1 Tax=Nonomuraea roseoviolacea TaxID=103837 RepID=UPI0031D402E8
MKDLLTHAMFAWLLPLCVTRTTTSRARSAAQMQAITRRVDNIRTILTLVRVAMLVVMLILTNRWRPAVHSAPAVRAATVALVACAESLGALVIGTEVRV